MTFLIRVLLKCMTIGITESGVNYVSRKMKRDAQMRCLNKTEKWVFWNVEQERFEVLGN